MVGEIVLHSRFGRGEVLEYAAPYMKVRFDGAAGEKRFTYPKAFETFMHFESAAMQARLNEDLESARAAERMKQEAQAEAARIREAELAEVRKAEAKAKRAAAARKAATTRASRKIAVKP